MFLVFAPPFRLYLSINILRSYKNKYLVSDRTLLPFIPFLHTFLLFLSTLTDAEQLTNISRKWSAVILILPRSESTTDYGDLSWLIWICKLPSGIKKTLYLQIWMPRWQLQHSVLHSIGIDLQPPSNVWSLTAKDRTTAIPPVQEYIINSTPTLWPINWQIIHLLVCGQF